MKHLNPLEREIFQTFSDAVNCDGIDGNYIFHHLVSEGFLHEDETLFMYNKLANILAPVVKYSMNPVDFDESMSHIQYMDFSRYNFTLTNKEALGIRKLCKFFLEDSYFREATLLARIACTLKKEDAGLLSLLALCKFSLALDNYYRNEMDTAFIYLGDAEHYFRKSLKIKPDHVESISGLGSVKMLNRPIQENDEIRPYDHLLAMPDYKKAYEIDPDDHFNCIQLANTYFWTGGARDAVSLLAKRFSSEISEVEYLEIQSLVNAFILHEEDQDERKIMVELFHFDNEKKLENDYVH